MNRRLLVILIVLAFLGPPSVGAGCLLGTCAAQPVAPASDGPETAAGGHCDAMAAGSHEPVPMPQGSWQDCCGSSLDEGVDATLTDGSSLSLSGLEPATGAVRGGSASGRSPTATPEAPPGTSSSLFTLHAAFLI